MFYRKDDVPLLERETAIYLAGLFDGEGCFMISTTVFRGKPTYNASVRLAMSDRPIMEWLAETLDRPLRIHGLGRNASHNAREIYRVVVQNVTGIISLVEQLLPFLRVKKAAAQTLLAYCHSRKEQYRAADKGYTASEIGLYLSLKTLNRVGRETPSGDEGKVSH